MTTAPYPQVTNELLSAYIDGAVSEEERRLIEQAVTEDPEVAWRLESLRATVRLLRELPALSLPRSFVLTPEQVGRAAVMPAAAGKMAPPRASRPEEEETSSGVWQYLRRGWERFWQGGNPELRNAMAASFALLLVLLITPRFLATTSFLSPGSVDTATAQTQVQAAAPLPTTAAISSNTELQNAAPTAVPVAKAGPEAAQQGAPAAAPETAGAASDTTSAGEAIAPAAQPPAVQPTVVAKAAANGQAENVQTDTVADQAAGNIAVQGGGAPGAMAASAPVGAPPGPALAAPSGRSVLDAASAQAGGMAPAASAGLTSAYAATPAAESSVSAAAEPATEPLAEAGTQELQATPVATVAAGAPAQGAQTDTEEASTAAATVSAELASAAVTEATSQAAGEAAPAAVEETPTTEACEMAVPCAATAVGSSSEPANQAVGAVPGTAVRQDGFPAWVGLVVQTAALLVALATLIFAILWWRSRSPHPRT